MKETARKTNIPKQKIISSFDNFVIDKTVRGLLLDLDNCCYRYELCHQAGLRAVQTLLKKSSATIPNFLKKYEQAKKIVKKRIPTQAASHSRLLYFQTLLENTDQKNVLPLALAMETTYWNTFIKSMRATKGLKTFLQSCRARKIPVCIVSDSTTHFQLKKIVALGISELIDYVVTSEEVGVEKPAPAIFKLALNKIKRQPHEVLMIGDHHLRDISGAKALSIPYIQIVHENFF